jgi:lipid A 3-O-deacylase
MIKVSRFLKLIFLWYGTITISFAITETKSSEMKTPTLFVEDRISTQVMIGPAFSDSGIGPHVNELNLMMVNSRIGWMLNTPSDQDGFFRGNFEGILELTTADIMSGYGNVVVGPAGLVRYNFVQPDWPIVPYLQVGAGIIYTDAYKNKYQRAIGEAIEFTPQASAGARWMLNNEWSLDSEFMYHHISNAGFNGRNLGVNGIGGNIGVTYYFDHLWE